MLRRIDFEYVYDVYSAWTKAIACKLVIKSGFDWKIICRNYIRFKCSSETFFGQSDD